MNPLSPGCGVQNSAEHIIINVSISIQCALPNSFFHCLLHYTTTHNPAYVVLLYHAAGPFEFFYSGYHRGKHSVSMIWHVLNLKHYLSTFVIIGSKGKESFRGLLFIAASAVYVPHFFCKHLTSHLHLVYILQYSTAWYVN